MSNLVSGFALADMRKSAVTTTINDDGTTSIRRVSSTEDRVEFERITTSFPVRSQIDALVMYHAGKKPMFLPSPSGNGNTGTVKELGDMAEEELQRSQRRYFTNTRQKSRVTLVELLAKKEQKARRTAKKKGLRKELAEVRKQARAGMCSNPGMMLDIEAEIRDVELEE